MVAYAVTILIGIADTFALSVTHVLACAIALTAFFALSHASTLTIRPIGDSILVVIAGAIAVLVNIGRTISLLRSLLCVLSVGYSGNCYNCKRCEKKFCFHFCSILMFVNAHTIGYFTSGETNDRIAISLF